MPTMARRHAGSLTVTDLLLELLVYLKSDVAYAGHALAQVVEVLVLLPALAGEHIRCQSNNDQRRGSGFVAGAVMLLQHHSLPELTAGAGCCLSACQRQ